ncbi:tryptophan synthase subunit alpha [Virgibacillus sp.]|uniref:tryptophan synthase subunit alpha n=1 Tax=Virgibacillus sp. TaxID=1872700 RepID=UPI0017BF99D1|nr:tryptophan synthase subunit alpha [Virgibacillus sp.]NWO13947.1 tryptophan synthase subunit alpha [Virgibacillus sp.]
MKQLALYLPCCYPNEDRFFKILDLMETYKVDVLELGIPVTDPHMDGAVIKESHQQVLVQGFDRTYLNQILMKIKEKYTFKVVLMTYKEGLDNYDLFTIDSQLIDGILCVDQEITFEDYPMPIQLYNETMSNQLLEEQLKNNRVFAYCMSGAGKTGSFNQVPTNYIETIKRIRKYSNLPIFVGFGIKDEQDVASVYYNGADGVIIGSFFVKMIASESLETINSYLKSLKNVSL